MDPMEEQQKTIARLKGIFDSFLQENFAITNSVYFEKLIAHLSAKENAYILQAPFALDWVDKCLTIISEDFNKVHPKVISFMLNFCGLMILNEWIVIEVKERKVMDRILDILDKELHQFNPSMKLGSIRVLAAISNYTLGFAYIRSTRAWRFLIDYCNQDHTLYVVRESRKLLYELIYKYSVKTNDEQVVVDILNEVVKPIVENVYQVGKDNIMINVDDRELQHKLSSTLDLISYIMQQTLESEEKTNITHLCKVHYQLEVNFWKLTEMTKNSFFLEKVLAALTSHNFAKLVYEKWTIGQIEPENFNKFGITFFNVMKFCVDRRECLIFLKLAELHHVLWKKLGVRAPAEVQFEHERVRFENQIILFHMLPVLFIVQSKEFQEEEIFENYIMKLFEICCEQTLRMCYLYRDLLFAEGHTQAAPVIADLAYKSIHGILSMENIMQRDQAVLVFQAMAYVLKEFVITSNPEYSDCIGWAEKPARIIPAKGASTGMYEATGALIVEIPNVLSAAIVGLQTLIQRYKITWKESIETICLVNCLAIIVQNENLLPRIAVQALKLIQLAVEHFLSPNMALLVDNLNGSGLICLGPIIIKRLHDIEWEVRDSVLELVTSIANISRYKFPAFQAFLSDINICPIVFDVAKNDCEAYVRASALKCLSQMTSINMIWENVISKMDLIEHLFFVLYNDSEGIVRKEAVHVLIKIYDHRKISNDLKDTLYSTLTHCVVADLHWEVKVNGLHFWELEIQKQFTHQGMIDGTFPTVTFSKENKKIVTLTEKEVNLRILKVFNELSQRGCLGILLKCLNDDCDLEVIRTAVCIIYRLLEKLKKYDYESIINDNANGRPNTQNNSSTEPPATTSATTEPTIDSLVPPLSLKVEDGTESPPNSDQVIDGILSTQDINLLAAVYERQMNLKVNGIVSNDNCDQTQTRHIDQHFYKKYAHVSPKEFIGTIKRINLDQLLRNRSDWFNCTDTFTSLLDDIAIATQPTDETFVSDCY